MIVNQEENLSQDCGTGVSPVSHHRPEACATSGLGKGSKFDKAPTRRGFTLAEVLVAVAIIAVLTGILLVGSRTIGDSRKRSAAHQQLAMIAQAIDNYSAFWPKWKIGPATVADKGWPDYIPGRLFDTTVFENVAGFNDHRTFDVQGGIFRQLPRVKHHDYVSLGDVLSGNICLAYCLTAHSGKGPYIPADDRAILKDIQDPILEEAFRQVGAIVSNPLLPAYTNYSGANRAQVLVDPWGTPYRYFWVSRSPAAYKGHLPVTTADINDPDFRTAVGFVVESAGPDRNFGNLWQLTSNIGNLDISEAEDNPTIEP